MTEKGVKIYFNTRGLKMYMLSHCSLKFKDKIWEEVWDFHPIIGILSVLLEGK